MVKLKSLITESITSQNIIDFLRPLKPGNLVLKERPSSIDDLYMIVETPNDNSRFLRVMEVGNIAYNSNGEKYASFIFNTKDASVISIMNFESYRRLKSDEIKLVKDAFKNPIHDRYLKIIKQKTGLSPKV